MKICIKSLAMFCSEMTATVPQLIPDPMEEQLSIAKLIFFPGYPYSQNINGMEITIIRLKNIHQVTIVSIYCTPKVAISNKLCVEHYNTFLHNSLLNSTF